MNMEIVRRFRKEGKENTKFILVNTSNWTLSFIPASKNKYMPIQQFKHAS